MTDSKLQHILTLWVYDE